MRITELSTDGLNLTPKADGRAVGAHVSDIIRDISNTVLKPGQREKYDDLSPDEQRRLGNYASVGWAWEHIIRRGMLDAGVNPGTDSQRFQCPGQLTLNGIHGSPDWLDTTVWENVEFKATWRSSNRPLDPDFWEWLTQFKAYCKMLGCTSTRLLVFYVNGDYRDSGPQFKDIRLNFTKMEIEDNWSMLLNHARAKGMVNGHATSTEARGTKRTKPRNR